ncbi:hypothetical protein [Flavobacterium sp.]|jgi:hypothetical protein|uniref:hypothetical protein n=1 Tax=Flavobacterium sp. TaxID=239 RepID=UPI0037C07D3F
METIIIILLLANVYLIVDYVLDNYYFNGTKKGGFLILNRHFFYEFIQIALLVALILMQITYLPNIPWYSWIFPLIFILTWSFRIYTTFKNRNCEIQIGKDKINYINSNGKTLTIENPNYISIQKIESDRLTIQSKATDTIVIFKNEKNETLEINLYTSSLNSYATQIHKSILKNFAGAKYEGIKPSKLLNLKNLSLSLFALVVLLFVFHVVK